MRRPLRAAIWIFGSALLSNAAAAAPTAPTGRWLTEDHSAVIQIAPCGGAELCGQIVGLTTTTPGGAMPTTTHGQSQCGLIILQIAALPQPDGTTHWRGTITDPRDGNTYQASITLDASQNLHLHGWLGLPIFGQTQTWTPYAGRTLTGCHLAAA